MEPQHVEHQEVESWASPTDHFRTRHKWLTIYTDKIFNGEMVLQKKTAILDKWFVPWFTPLYFFATHFSQRNRNLFLVENHLNYRPWSHRRNDEDSTY